MSDSMDLKRRIHNAEGVQAVEQVKAVHCYLHARGESREEWETIWSRSEEVSWAHCFGRMRGWKQVWNGSVTQYDHQAYEKYLRIYEMYPEVGGKDPRPLLSCVIHSLASGIIEVAEDGQSARSYYYTPGIISGYLEDDGKRFTKLLWERYGSDFVYEDGQWLYLHEQVCPDIEGNCDVGNWGRDAYLKEAAAEGTEIELSPGMAESAPVCADPGPLHYTYSTIQTVQETVPWPEPYRTLDDDNTYTKTALV